MMCDQPLVEGKENMTTNIKQELAAWVAQKQKIAKPKRRECVAIFLAVREDVKAAIAAGYALKTIWEHMRETGRVSFRYETFLRYVRRHITNAPPERPKQPGTVKPTAQDRGADEVMLTVSSEPKKVKLSQTRSFSFDPSPKREDLI